MALTRSQQMSRIKGRNTRPEIRLRKALWAVGLRYRLHHRTPAGRPDVVFPGRKVAVFIDGCFWHGCPHHYVRPCSREEFWSGKLRENVDRDRRQTLALEAAGWRVVRLWEHEIYETLEDCVARVRAAIGDESWEPEPGFRVVLVEEIEPETRIERRHMEVLREPDICRHEEGRRITAKWRRPR